MSLAPLEGEEGKEERKEGSQTVSQSVDDITLRLSLPLPLCEVVDVANLTDTITLAGHATGSPFLAHRIKKPSGTRSLPPYSA